jgi:hypothetical protein
MSTHDIIVAAYFAVAAIVGYWSARETYRGVSRDIPKESTGWALFVWVVYGLCWPVLVFGFVLYVVFTTEWWKSLGRKLFG